MSSRVTVAVFGSSQTQPGTEEWADAEKVGAHLARSGLAVMTGGYGGSMEAVSKGAAENGGHVIGVTAPPLFPGRHGANPYVAELIEADGLAERVGTMIRRARGVIALPGSIGTATELLIAWNVNHIVRRNGGRRLPTVAVGEAWGAVRQSLAENIGAVASDIHPATTVTEGVEWLLEQPEMRWDE